MKKRDTNRQNLVAPNPCFCLNSRKLCCHIFHQLNFFQKTDRTQTLKTSRTIKMLLCDTSYKGRLWEKLLVAATNFEGQKRQLSEWQKRVVSKKPLIFVKCSFPLIETWNRMGVYQLYFRGGCPLTAEKKLIKICVLMNTSQGSNSLKQTDCVFCESLIWQKFESCSCAKFLPNEKTSVRNR